MNIQTLGLGRATTAAASSVRAGVANAYARLAGSDDYIKNSRYLSAIQVCVVTVSCAATGAVNSLAHVSRLGLPLAIALAVVVTGFVEGFYFVLHHGLTTTYKSGKQRFYATVCYRLIQATMVLNIALLCCYVVGFGVPPWLNLWNHYSILCHAALAIIGVAAVRDNDTVVAHRMLALRAETAEQDLIVGRRAAALGSPYAFVATAIKGHFENLGLAFRILFTRSGFSKRFVEQMRQIEAEQFNYLDALTPGPMQTLPAPRRPGFVTNQAGQQSPKAPGNWI
jgi:hypothetical protein